MPITSEGPDGPEGRLAQDPVSHVTGKASRSAGADNLRWLDLTHRALEGLNTCDDIYRPTNFWRPGVEALTSDMRRLGIEAFKTWPAAYFWFYPLYGVDQHGHKARHLWPAIESIGPLEDEQAWMHALRGTGDAMRDYDAARLAWDQHNWPADLESYGESEVGLRPQGYVLNSEADAYFTKPYLNYLLCMSALSRHVDAPPRSFVELGGGFGSLGEVVLARDPSARYVNFDIPPLLTVASYYLTALFGEQQVVTFTPDFPTTGRVEIERAACLPNWRLPDLVGDFEVFVNAFSFQEMEPPVVKHYVDIIANLGVRFVVSLNSVKGKPIALKDSDIGVQEQVISSTIISMFEEKNYELCARYNRPLISAFGEIAVLRKRN